MGGRGDSHYNFLQEYASQNIRFDGQGKRGDAAGFLLGFVKSGLRFGEDWEASVLGYWQKC